MREIDDTRLTICSTILLAGHDTTAHTMAWFFYEAAKHPETQERIREEIAAVRARSSEAEYSAADLDGMVYTQAALKVIALPTSFDSNARF